MTIEEAKAVIYGNVVYACEKAGFSPCTTKLVQDACDMIIAMADAPTIEGPQGEWKHLEGDEWVCSNCGYVVCTEGSWEHPLERGKNYCEHCGARM